MTPRLKVVSLLAGSAAVGIVSSSPTGHRLDRGFFAKVNAGRGGAADLFFRGVTEAGSIWGSIGAASTLAALGRRAAASRALGAAATMWTVGQGLKKAVLRARPYDAFPDTVRLVIGRPRGTSWPSSHPAVLLAFVSVAGRELGLSSSSRRGLAALVGAVAVSRVYLGVHYPSDVVGGMLIGRAIGLAWPVHPSSGS